VLAEPARAAWKTVDVDELLCVRVGQLPYGLGREAQKRLESARQADEIGDVLLLLEHPPVYTKGRRTEAGELGMGEEWYRMQGIEVCEADRGGRVTYHGPGQLVGYPIVSLNHLARPAAPGREAEEVRGMGVAAYVRRLERLMIETLGAAGVEAQVIEGLTGVWTAGPPPGPDAFDDAARKIGSIGVHVSRGVTTHGFAINVNNDLQPFEWVVPCGIEGCQMTSVCRETGGPYEMGALMDIVSERFGAIYEREPAAVSPAELASRVDGLEALAQAAPFDPSGAAAAVG
jgi:lipoyl(octanoyl) transferase